MSTTEQEIFSPSLGRQNHLWLSGFLLLGLLPGLLGPLLISWQDYLEIDPRALGLHALSLNAGCFGGLFVGDSWRQTTSFACVLCAVALGVLGFIGPPVPWGFRLLALAAVGTAAGTLSAPLGRAIGPAMHAAPAHVGNICGAYFGAGALLATVVLDAAYTAGHPEFGPALLAAVPAAYLLLTRKNKPEDSTEIPSRKQNVRPIATSLLSVLLFFQIGNEWVLAIWLPFFLIHKLGASPSVAISLLAIHFVFLLFGRWLAKALLPIVNHRRFLLAGVALSIGGYVLLVTGHTLPSATTALILLGLALGPVFPVTAENLDRDLSGASVHRILLAAMSGACFEPFLAGFVSAEFGVANIMFVPGIGAAIVCVIALLILLESRLVGGSEIAL